MRTHDPASYASEKKRPRHPVRRLLAILALTLLAAYAAAFSYLLVAQESALFTLGPASYGAEDCRFIPGRNGRKIACAYFSFPGARRTLIYAHGSATDLGGVADILALHRDLGVNVLAYDYPGVGLSEGPLTETACYEAAEDVYTWLRATGVPAHDILLYGRSIGTAPALHLAGRDEVGGVILASPFTSAFGHRAWMHLFPFDWFPNQDLIAHVSAPILILHGTHDQTIAAENGRRLASLAPSPTRFVALADRDHADLHEDPSYHAAILTWTAALP